MNESPCWLCREIGCGCNPLFVKRLQRFSERAEKGEPLFQGTDANTIPEQEQRDYGESQEQRDDELDPVVDARRDQDLDEIDPRNRRKLIRDARRKRKSAHHHDHAATPE